MMRVFEWLAGKLPRNEYGWVDPEAVGWRLAYILNGLLEWYEWAMIEWLFWNFVTIVGSLLLPRRVFDGFFHILAEKWWKKVCQP